VSKAEGIWLSTSNLIYCPPVREAFRALGLDPAKPADWEVLISRLCDAQFGKRSGAPKAWDRSKLCQLAADFARVQAANPHKTHEDIRKLLVRDKRFGDRYHKIGHETIRRRIPEARKELASVIAVFKSEVQSELKLSSLTPAQEKQVEDWTIEKYSTMINRWFDPYLLLSLDEIKAIVRGN
jgi:hypothetical protein